MSGERATFCGVDFEETAAWLEKRGYRGLTLTRLTTPEPGWLAVAEPFDTVEERTISPLGSVAGAGATEEEALAKPPVRGE